MDNSAPVPDPRLRAKFLLIGEKVRVWEGSPKNSKLLDGYSAQAYCRFCSASVVVTISFLSYNKAENMDRTTDVLYTLQWADKCFQNCIVPGRSGSSPNTWFLGHTRVHIPNGTSVALAVFDRAHSCSQLTDKQTTLHM